MGNIAPPVPSYSILTYISPTTLLKSTYGWAGFRKRLDSGVRSCAPGWVARVLFCSGYLCLPTPLILTLFRVPIMGHMFSFLFTNSISTAQGGTSRAGLLTPQTKRLRSCSQAIPIILGNPPCSPTWVNSLDGSGCCPVPFRSTLSGSVQCQTLALPRGKWAIKHDRVLTPWGPSLGRATGWHFRHDERPHVPALFSSCLSIVTGGRAFCYSMRLRAVCF